MKKEFVILSILSSLFLVVYFLFPNLEAKKDNKIVDSTIVKELSNTENQFLNSQNFKILTFDIVRVTEHGDVVMAGQSEPNKEIELINNDKIVSSFFSDANGEWIWVSDYPLEKGIKKFELKYVNNKDNLESKSQTVIIFNDKKKIRPTVAKILNGPNKKVDILNLEKINDGLSLDAVEYLPSGKLILSGRTLPNNKIKFLKAQKEIGSYFSDDDGDWKFNLNFDSLKDETLTISTQIKNEEILLSFTQTDLNFRLKLNDKYSDQNQIIVEPGNSLWRIARKTMGGGIFYTEIYKNNLKRIKNPDLIYPGQVFNIPNIKQKIVYE